MEFLHQIMPRVEAAIEEVKSRESDGVKYRKLGFKVDRVTGEDIVIRLYADTIDLEPIDGPPLAS